PEPAFASFHSMDICAGVRCSVRVNDPARDAAKVRILYSQINFDRALAVDRDPGKVSLVFLQSGVISDRICRLQGEGRALCARYMRISGMSHDIIFARAEVKENKLPVRIRHRCRDAAAPNT